MVIKQYTKTIMKKILFTFLLLFILTGCDGASKVDGPNTPDENCETNPDMATCQSLEDECEEKPDALGCEETSGGLEYLPVSGYETYDMNKISINSHVIEVLTNTAQMDNIYTIVYFDKDEIIYQGKDHQFHSIIDGVHKSYNVFGYETGEQVNTPQLLGYNPQTRVLRVSPVHIQIGGNATTMFSYSLSLEKVTAVSMAYGINSEVLAITNNGVVIEDSGVVDYYGIDFELITSKEEGTYLGNAYKLNETHNQYFLFSTYENSSCKVEVYDGKGFVKTIPLDIECTRGYAVLSNTENIYFLLGKEFDTYNLYEFDSNELTISMIDLDGNSVDYIEDQSSYLEIYKFKLSNNTIIGVNDDMDFTNAIENTRDVECIGDTFYVEEDSFNNDEKIIYDLDGNLLQEINVRQAVKQEGEFLIVANGFSDFGILYDVYLDGEILFAETVKDFIKINNNYVLYKGNLTTNGFDVIYHNINTDEKTILKEYTNISNGLDIYSMGRTVLFDNDAFGIINALTNEFDFYDSTGILLDTFTYVGNYYRFQILLVNDDNELIIMYSR